MARKKQIPVAKRKVKPGVQKTWKAKARTKDGRVPQGRTLQTYDHYLGKQKKKPSTKERRVVVIEANKRNELAVVPLSSSAGNNRTQLPRNKSGSIYYKHFIEINDNEGKPITVGKKFRENNPDNDLSQRTVKSIKNKCLNDCKPKQANQNNMKKFNK